MNDENLILNEDEILDLMIESLSLMKNAKTVMNYGEEGSKTTAIELVKEFQRMCKNRIKELEKTKSVDFYEKLKESKAIFDDPRIWNNLES